LSETLKDLAIKVIFGAAPCGGGTSDIAFLQSFFRQGEAKSVK
jgi:hypothetical protein